MNNLSSSAAGSRGPAPATITVGDVWYALFRHKWKVVILSVLGVVAAGVVYISNKPPYESEAKLLVRYVVETPAVEALGPDGQVNKPPSSAANIINSEAEIIQSLDLCRQVAESIGAERILAKSKLAGTPGQTNLSAAAGMILGGLKIEVPKVSNVIKLTMTHPDPEIAQLALQKIIEFYFKKHLEIHRGLGTMDSALTTQTDQLRMSLTRTDEELQQLRTSANVVSLEDSRKAITEQMGTIRQMIVAAEAELAEYQVMTNAAPVGVTNVFPVPTRSTAASPGREVASTPVAATTNLSASPSTAVAAERAAEDRKRLAAQIESLRRQEQDLRELRTAAGVAATDGKSNYNDQIRRVREAILKAEQELADSSVALASPTTPAVGPAPVAAVVAQTVPEVAATGLEPGASNAPSARFMEYKAVLGRLEMLHRLEQEYQNIYTDGNRTLMRTRAQLVEAEATRKAIENENPNFAAYFQPGNASSALKSGGGGQIPSPFSPGGAVDPNRPRVLEAKLKNLYAQMDKQRQEAVALEQFETKLNQLLRKRELEEKNYRHFSASLEQKRFDGLLGSGKLANISEVQTPSPPQLSDGKRVKIAAMALAGGLLGGIGLALLIELMLDHSVRRSMQLETAMALPPLSTIPRVRFGGSKKKLQLGNGGGGDLKKHEGMGTDIPGWSPGHPLRRHIEALRDRTLMHFEGDLRKPKLIGVTGCRHGSGVTTIACALSAALSESGDGRVLLINMDAGSQSLHPMLLGRDACSLVDVVDAGKRETALVGNNLYVADGRGDGNSIYHPTSIARMLPKIKMSDYDYVVFDMPNLSPTSITSKLAGMVDLVFVVAESEKDSQNNLKRACQLLAENNATFRVVLNKFERYVPKWLNQEV